MADGPEQPQYENMKTRRIEDEELLAKQNNSLQESVYCNLFRDCTAMNNKKSPQNRCCCVPLCNQKGSIGPDDQKNFFFTQTFHYH